MLQVLALLGGVPEVVQVPEVVAELAGLEALPAALSAG